MLDMALCISALLKIEKENTGFKEVYSVKNF